MNTTLLRLLLIWAERLGLLVMIAAICFAWWFFQIRKPEVRQLPRMNLSAQEETDTVVLPPSVVYEDVRDIFEKRDLFARKIVGIGAVAVPLLDGTQLPSQFKVVGVLLGKDPKIIIEDQVARQTFFVDKEGGAPGMKIDHVDMGRVYLNYSGTVYSIQ